MNRRFWIEGNDQNSNCALTKNEISHKLRLAVGRGINKSMLEKEEERRRIADVIIERKVVDHLKTLVTIKEKSISYEKFAELAAEVK